MTDRIRFDDGALYEHVMGKWSQLVGEIFLDWLQPETDLRWLDVGCGTGAFTEMVARRCHPALLHGIDLSREQLDYARTRPALQAAVLQQGDAMMLPFPDDSFDVAVMPLVIFFVPDPMQGVSEMARVVAEGGWVCAYAWDLLGGGSPYSLLETELRRLGVAPAYPPNPGASQIEALQKLWAVAGLDQIETREIVVQRRFADIDDYWATILGMPHVGKHFSTLSAQQIHEMKARFQAQLPSEASGELIGSARANAVKGCVRQ